MDPGTEVDPRVHRYLERRAIHPRAMTRLAGDASTRSYYRLELEDETRVLALMAGPFDPREEPVLNVARLFQLIPIRIPRIDDVSGSDGVVLLEDCGDTLLQDVTVSSGVHIAEAVYRDAVAILARLQRRGRELEDDSFFPFRIEFDRDKLAWELDYFCRHFLEGLVGARPTAADREALDRSFSSLAAELAARPQVLCHRDYHSRNLLWSKEELVVIDFQDARMGPVSYDLVSLLMDSYVELTSDFVEAMREDFQRQTSFPELDEEFDPMALQRNLKALGTFGYQITARGKSIYRRYIRHTLDLVRNNLTRNPRWDELRSTLATYLPELS